MPSPWKTSTGVPCLLGHKNPPEHLWGLVHGSRSLEDLGRGSRENHEQVVWL